jgi:phytoene dehydrogenase-like protein
MGTNPGLGATLPGGRKMKYNVVVVGAGAAGLTAAAFLTKYGQTPLLIEKEAQCGGLITSFSRNGFTFDGGIRALENAGALFPMIKALGIEIEMIKSSVSVGIEDKIIAIESHENFTDYENLLIALYPESKDEISRIIDDTQEITHLMDIQYGINNPLFLDVKEDLDYFIKAVFPWLFKYVLTVPKVTRKNLPVATYLEKFTQNQALLDIITQHFFTETPAYFALSYFRLYLDYYYPKGGTGVFSQKLTDFILQNGGEIQTNTAITAINLEQKKLRTSAGDEIAYDQLLWAADQKTLYEIIDTQNQIDQNLHEIINDKRNQLSELTGNDSVLTLYLTTDLDKAYFESISNPHFFYTPSRRGQSLAGEIPSQGSWEEILDWLARYLSLTTYEISIPALRDASLAPEGKTGLIISVLFDYHLTKHIHENGWDEDFRDEVAILMIKTLQETVYPGLNEAIIDKFIATPLTLARRSGNTHGAITGWSFTNHIMPSENRLIKITNAVNTHFPNVFQAGQWTYSPSGFPVALITGKIAADKVNKQLKK